MINNARLSSHIKGIPMRGIVINAIGFEALGMLSQLISDHQLSCCHVTIMNDIHKLGPKQNELSQPTRIEMVHCYSQITGLS